MGEGVGDGLGCVGVEGVVWGRGEAVWKDKFERSEVLAFEDAIASANEGGG